MITSLPYSSTNNKNVGQTQSSTDGRCCPTMSPATDVVVLGTSLSATAVTECSKHHDVVVSQPRKLIVPSLPAPTVIRDGQMSMNDDEVKTCCMKTNVANDTKNEKVDEKCDGEDVIRSRIGHSDHHRQQEQEKSINNFCETTPITTFSTVSRSDPSDEITIDDEDINSALNKSSMCQTTTTSNSIGAQTASVVNKTQNIGGSTSKASSKLIETTPIPTLPPKSPRKLNGTNNMKKPKSKNNGGSNVWVRTFRKIMAPGTTTNKNNSNNNNNSPVVPTLNILKWKYHLFLACRSGQNEAIDQLLSILYDSCRGTDKTSTMTGSSCYPHEDETEHSHNNNNAMIDESSYNGHEQSDDFTVTETDVDPVTVATRPANSLDLGTILLDDNGNNPLHVACYYNQHATVAYLLQQYHYKNKIVGTATTNNNNDHHSLDDASNFYHLDLNHTNYEGNTPLHIVCVLNHHDLLTLLLSSFDGQTEQQSPIDIDITILNHQKQTPLHCASHKGNVQSVQIMLRYMLKLRRSRAFKYRSNNQNIHNNKILPDNVIDSGDSNSPNDDLSCCSSVVQEETTFNDENTSSSTVTLTSNSTIQTGIGKNVSTKDDEDTVSSTLTIEVDDNRCIRRELRNHAGPLTDDKYTLNHDLKINSHITKEVKIIGTNVCTVGLSDQDDARHQEQQGCRNIPQLKLIDDDMTTPVAAATCTPSTAIATANSHLVSTQMKRTSIPTVVVTANPDPTTAVKVGLTPTRNRLARFLSRSQSGRKLITNTTTPKMKNNNQKDIIEPRLRRTTGSTISSRDDIVDDDEGEENDDIDDAVVSNSNPFEI